MLDDVVAAVRATSPAATGRRTRRRRNSEITPTMIQPEVRRTASSTSSTNDDAEERVGGAGQRVAVPEIVAAGEQVGDRRDAEQRADHVPPHEAVAEALGDREQQEHEQQHEADVHRTQHLRRHDVRPPRTGGTATWRRAASSSGAPSQPRIAAGRALLFLDVLFRLAAAARHRFRRRRARPSPAELRSRLLLPMYGAALRRAPDAARGVSCIRT